MAQLRETIERSPVPEILILLLLHIRMEIVIVLVSTCHANQAPDRLHMLKVRSAILKYIAVVCRTNSILGLKCLSRPHFAKILVGFRHGAFMVKMLWLWTRSQEVVSSKG